MRPLHLDAGATIFRTGDPSRGVYVIEEGEVAITVGTGTEVARLHAGALFGESGVLESRPRAATATAITATTLLETDAETFLHAFGLNNDRALALVKLLCSRLRSTNLRSAQPALEPGRMNAAIRLFLDHDRLPTELRMAPVDVAHLPFQVGNRYGGETLPIASNRSCCIPARGDSGFAAPHFEILRRGGKLCVRDIATAHGTIVNGVPITRASIEPVLALRQGDNEVIAGRADSVFRFRIAVSAGRE